MENTPVERKNKTNAKSSSHSSLRVKKATRKRVMEILAKANGKDFGRRIGAEDVILLAISRVTSDDIIALQHTSMSRADRLELDYKEYVSQNGSISKDDYLGKRLDGEIPDPRKPAKEGVQDVENQPE